MRTRCEHKRTSTQPSHACRAASACRQHTAKPRHASAAQPSTVPHAALPSPSVPSLVSTLNASYSVPKFCIPLLDERQALNRAARPSLPLLRGAASPTVPSLLSHVSCLCAHSLSNATLTIEQCYC